MLKCIESSSGNIFDCRGGYNLICQQQLNAPLGVFVVRGDNDADNWMNSFVNTPYKIANNDSETVDTEQFAITLLSVADSRYLTYQIPMTNKFHIVLGHVPDFALRKPEGDLLVAGHTHGGQIQIPFVGPWLHYPCSAQMGRRLHDRHRQRHHALNLPRSRNGTRNRPSTPLLLPPRAGVHRRNPNSAVVSYRVMLGSIVQELLSTAVDMK